MKIEKFEFDFAFLANDYPSTFIYKGIKYKTVSHAYYALKAENSDDAKRIREYQDVREAIKEGKKAKTKNTWQSECRNIMKELLIEKFNNPFLRPRLIETGEAVLGNGKNFVGELLMEVRNEIIST